MWRLLPNVLPAFVAWQVETSITVAVAILKDSANLLGFSWRRCADNLRKAQQVVLSGNPDLVINSRFTRNTGEVRALVNFAGDSKCVQVLRRCINENLVGVAVPDASLDASTAFAVTGQDGASFTVEKPAKPAAHKLRVHRRIIR